jgi:hypothetical protein
VLTEKRFQTWDDFYDILKIVSFEDEDFAEGVRFGTVEVEACNYPESALRTQEELLQVVASVVLRQRRTQVEDLPTWQHCLETTNVGAERTVPQNILPASMSRRISSEHAGAFGPQVERGLAAVGGEESVEFFEDDPRLDSYHSADRVEALDAIHSAQTEHYLIEDGHTASHQSRVSSLRHHCESPFVAVSEYLGYFFSRLGRQDQLRASFVVFPELEIVWFYFVWVGDDLFALQKRFEILYISIFHHPKRFSLNVLSFK